MITGIIVALALTWIALIALALYTQSIGHVVDRLCGIEDRR